MDPMYHLMGLLIASCVCLLIFCQESSRQKKLQKKKWKLFHEKFNKQSDDLLQKQAQLLADRGVELYKIQQIHQHLLYPDTESYGTTLSASDIRECISIIDNMLKEEDDQILRHQLLFIQEDFRSLL